MLFLIQRDLCCRQQCRPLRKRKEVGRYAKLDERDKLIAIVGSKLGMITSAGVRNNGHDQDTAYGPEWSCLPQELVLTRWQTERRFIDSGRYTRNAMSIN